MLSYDKFLVLLCISLASVVNGESHQRYQKWKSAMSLMAEIEPYNESLWPSIYESREEEVQVCQLTDDPEAADEW